MLGDGMARERKRDDQVTGEKAECAKAEGAKDNAHLRNEHAPGNVPDLFLGERQRLQYIGLMCLVAAGWSRFDGFASPSIGVESYTGGYFGAAVPSETRPGTWTSPVGFDSFGYDAAAAPESLVFALIYAFALAALPLSLWHSTRYPRNCACGTGRDLMRTMLQGIGDVLLTPVRAFLPGEVPLLGFQRTAFNEKVIAQCPSLFSFKETAWLRHPFLCFAILSCFDFMGHGRDRHFVRREHVQAPDGGIVALDWWEETLPGVTVEPQKVLIVGSTFTSDSLPSMCRGICRFFSARGWRCVVLVKRGCGLTLPNEQPGGVKPWCLAGLEDTELAVRHVASAFPGLPVCAIGVSTSAGQFRNYLNARGDRAELTAAVLLDAAPEWRWALEGCDKRMPLITFILAQAAKFSHRRWREWKVQTGEKVASDVVAASGHGAAADKLGMISSLAPLGQASDEDEPGFMLSFVRDEMAPAQGFEATIDGARRYLDACAPAPARGCTVPTLELVTFNDQLMTPEMVQQVCNFSQESPHIVTAVTREGTHMVRWEGFWRPRCWVTPVSFEFLEAVLSARSSNASANERMPQ